MALQINPLCFFLSLVQLLQQTGVDEQLLFTAFINAGSGLGSTEKTWWTV